MITDNKIELSLGLGLTLTFYKLKEENYNKMCAGDYSVALPVVYEGEKMWAFRDDYGYTALPMNSWVVSINGKALQRVPDEFLSMLKELDKENNKWQIKNR